MEKLNLENNAEHTNETIELEGGNNLQIPMFGRPIANGINELIKIFAILRHLKEAGFSDKKKIEETAKDLFNELGVQIFEYENVFSDKFINQILSKDKIDTFKTKLNGRAIIINSNSTVESVMETSIPKRELSNSSTPNKRIGKEQAVADTMYAGLDSLDFKDLEKVVDWLYEYNTHVSTVGVEDHKAEVIEKFKLHGYNTEKNDEIDFMLGEVLQDKKKFGEALVGFMLQNLTLFREQQMKEAINDWKKGR